MRRRTFITLLGGTAALWPRALRAQQSAMPVIGFMHSASPNYFSPFRAGFGQGLKEAGFVEGQNLTIERRWAEGHYDRLPELAADLASRKVAVIFAAGGTDPAKAAEVATTTIPIVFVSAADPVRTGLVPSLSRPGGNVTGVSLLASALNGKRLDLLRELVPQAAAIGTLINPTYPEAKAQAEEFRAAASQLGVKLVALLASTPAEIDAAFASLDQEPIGALVIGNDPFFGGRRDQIVALAARRSLPTMHYQRESVEIGGLISYGPSFPDGYRQGGFYVGRILQGEKPGDLPVMQPTKFELVLNLKTAKALGLKVAAQVLATADEVIE
ncbi:MAG TPA: ABC transporter substrate-binding protein [Xanthobacteraceae bacterium]|jgi:putative ABC transport system substrate-binding protein|nr:ABC transporter substrate-binding protein [Xanthobacteraceae bacterium]